MQVFLSAHFSFFVRRGSKGHNLRAYHILRGTNLIYVSVGNSDSFIFIFLPGGIDRTEHMKTEICNMG